MIYLLIFALEMFATGGTVFGAKTSSGIENIATSNQTGLLLPVVTESTNVFTAAWAEITNVAAYLQVLIGILGLWAPTVFSGYLIWFWWFVCFPVDCGLIASIVFIVRGVHSA